MLRNVYECTTSKNPRYVFIYLLEILIDKSKIQEILKHIYETKYSVKNKITNISCITIKIIKWKITMYD